jgi:hypothetical protein
MKKLFTCLYLIPGLLALSGLALAQSVAGEWNATMETPGEPVNYKAIFKVDGEKLSGTIKRSSGDTALQGTVKGKEIKFSYTVDYNGQALAISVTGTLEGDTIKGSVDIANGAYQGAWMAKRASGATTSITQSAPASPTGADEWELTINSPQGTTTSTLAYTKEGEAIKGSLRSERGQLPMQGTLKGNDITIKFTVKFQDNDLPITLTGKVDGAAMKGEADFGGLAQGDWMARRKAGGSAPAAASQTSSSSTINVTGSWVLEVETGQGNGSPSFTFKQEGEKLTGHYKGAFGEADLTGTVKGEQIEFSFKVTGQADATIVYRGTTDGKTMKGKVALGELGEGTFTGKKQ